MVIKRIIMIILLILILSVGIFGLSRNNNLDKRIENLKENDILFIYDSTSQYFDQYQSSIDEINYYNDMYELNIQFFDLKGSKKIFQKLKDKDKDLFYNSQPIIQILKKENSIFFQNIIEKEELLEFLKQNNCLKNDFDKYDILSAEKFNEIKKDNKQYLIVIENGDKESIKLRKKIFKLSKQYHFKFYSFEPFLIKNIDTNYRFNIDDLPYILIYKNQKQQTMIKNITSKQIEQKLIDIKFISKGG